jgi:hypothetical protein
MIEFIAGLIAGIVGMAILIMVMALIEMDRMKRL